MPEVIKPADRLHKFSRWTLLKASIADRVRHHKEKKQQVGHKASTSKKEVKKVVPKSSITPEKKAVPIAKSVTKESSVSTVVKKPVQEFKRPIDQILVGSWNAIKAIPEKQGKGVVNIYDKLRFPKLTTEEQKVQDKVHVFLKKYQKEIGWGVTGVEAAAVTYGVVKGLQYLKKRRSLKNLMRSGADVRMGSAAMEDDDSPLHTLADLMLKDMLKGESKPVKRSVKRVQEFINKPKNDDDLLGKLPTDFVEMLPVFAVRFYSFAEAQNVANLVNPLADYEAQQSKLLEILRQFFEADAAETGNLGPMGGSGEEDSGARLGVLLTGRVLGMLGYPGLEELGVRFKPKPLE